MKIIAYVLIALGLGYTAANAGSFEAAWALPASQIPLALLELLVVPLSGFLLAGILFLSHRLPRFLATFIGTLAATHIVLVGLLLLGTVGTVPFGWDAYIPPASMAVATSVASALIYACSFIPVIQTIMAIGDRFYLADERGELSFGRFGSVRAREGTIAIALLAVIIAINLIQVALSVRFNFFYRDMFNALQTKDATTFWYQIFVIFISFAAIWVMVGLAEMLLRYFLLIRWRSYLNRYYVDNWLGDGLHYEMQLVGNGTDNPDQRITEDLRNYVESTIGLSIQLLNQIATLVSFVMILWGLSAGFTLPFTDIPIPGLLVWVALLYAVLGTWLIHLIGRPLIGLNFQKERVEADYRFSLARVREYSEQIALQKGQHAEAERLHKRFGAVIGNYLDIAWRTLKLTTFRFSFMQANVIFPYLLTAPYYFINKITLGQMQQTVDAFSRVQDAFNFFITIYTSLAEYKAVIDRLTTFENSMKRVEREHLQHPAAKIAGGESRDVRLRDVTVRLPDGQVLMGNFDLDFRKGEAILFTGPSGSGKSTLFRTIAGIWPFSSGRIEIPKDESVLELPQRPYVPQGTLRDAVTYPATAGTYSDAEITAALEAAKLGQFTESLDEERLWSQTLSLGEQQRLAVARALLAKPDWLFLDEATAALDEETEAAIYETLKSKLPQTTIVSIGHRSTLFAFHNRRIDVRNGADGKPVWQDKALLR